MTQTVMHRFTFENGKMVEWLGTEDTAMTNSVYNAVAGIGACIASSLLPPALPMIGSLAPCERIFGAKGDGVGLLTFVALRSRSVIGS